MSKLTTDADKKGLGERLLCVRMWVGQSQFEFADTLGMAPRAYANYERGQREIPVAVLLRLYQFLRIDPVWLLTGTATSKEAVVPELRNHRQRAPKRPARARPANFHAAPEARQAAKPAPL